MRRAYESDIVAAAKFEFEHDFGETLDGDLVLALSFPSLGDLMILAVNAAKIAVAEEDISGSVCPAQARFFAKMRRVARDDRQAP